MIKARHHWFYEWFFDGFVRLRMKFLFRQVRIHQNHRDNGQPILLLGNHSSWWDGFLAWQMCKKIYRRRFHVMVLERELSKRRFLSRLGAFSINKNSRSLINTLDYAAGLLQDPGNLVMIYPQGELQSVHLRPLKFQEGWQRLIKKTGSPIQLVFLVSLSDFGSKPRQVINHYLEEYSGEADPVKLEAAYNNFLERCIKHQNHNL